MGRARRAFRPATPRRVLFATLLAGLLPWSVQTVGGGPFLLRFAWGAVSARGGLGPSAEVGFAPRLAVSVLLDYPLFVGPPHLLQWALAALCWALALASAAAGLVDAEDVRLTAGLLALAGASNLVVALAFGLQVGRAAYPVGTLVLWTVAAWRYRAARTGESE